MLIFYIFIKDLVEAIKIKDERFTVLHEEKCQLSAPSIIDVYISLLLQNNPTPKMAIVSFSFRSFVLHLFLQT